MKPKNIKEFQALVERYETITLEEIKANPDPEILTGFGNSGTCTLCIKAGNCDKCVYGESDTAYYACIDGENKKTYFTIDNANTPRKILNAYRARAKHLRKNYSQYLK